MLPAWFQALRLRYVRSTMFCYIVAYLLFVYKIVFVNADSGEGYITVDGNESDRYVHAKCLISSDY